MCLSVRGGGQESIVKRSGRKTSQPQQELRFAKAAEVLETKIQKDCTFDSCQACFREEGYRRNPRPPSSDESLAFALQAATSFRCEAEENPSGYIGGPPLTKHTQYRTTGNKPVLSVQGSSVCTIHSWSCSTRVF